LAQGTIIEGIERKEIECLQVPVPSTLDEQHRVAAILDTVDDAIRHTEALIAKLKRIKAGLLHDILTRGIDENGELRDPVAHPEQFKDSELGTVPTVWEVAGLESRRTQDRPYIKTGPFGSSMKNAEWVAEGIPVITIGALGEGHIIKQQLLYITEKKARAFMQYRVQKGDLVFSRVADVGRSIVIGDAENGWIMSSNLLRVSLDHSRVHSSFLQLEFAYGENVRQQVRRSVNAGGREVANTAILDNLWFAWPPFEEQKRIADKSEKEDEHLRSEEEYLAKLQKLKQGLMQDLLIRRVRVNDIHLDLPEVAV